MNLYRLIYVSRATAPIDPKTIHAIAEASAARNRELGITGILLSNRTHFLQVLEGEMFPVNQVYRLILADTRHTDILLLGYRPIRKVQFERWAMRGTSTGLIGRILLAQLKEKYGEAGGDLKIPEDEHLAYALLLDVDQFLRENG